MLALSVSISTSSSPRFTSAPSDFSHLRIVPSSIESESRGIATAGMARRIARVRQAPAAAGSGRGPCARSVPHPRSRPPRAPALLDPAEPPDREGDRPGEREQTDDDVADGVQVDGRHPAPEAAVEPEPVARDGEQLDRPDDERDGDRE